MSERINNTFQEIWSALMEADRIVIPLHRGPDPDSMASCVAFAKILQSKGKHVTVYSASPVLDIDLLKQMPIIEEDIASIDEASYDLFLALDVSYLNRYSKSENFITNAVVINIDHHPDNTYFGTYNYVMTESKSTCEILYQLFVAVDVEITKPTAELLFTGMIADNGWFQFEATPQSFEIAKELVQNGVNTRIVSYEMQKTNIRNLNVLGRVYSRVIQENGDNFAYSYLTYDDLLEMGIVDESVYKGGQIFKYIDGVDFGVILTEKERGRFSGSMRTREAHNYDVSEVARNMSGSEHGGGHPMAAGFDFKATSVDEVLNRMREVIQELKK